MKKILISSALAIVFGAGLAQASMTAQQIADKFPGATQIQIKRDTAKTTVYVTMNGEQIAVVFDNATDQEISRGPMPTNDPNGSGDDNDGDHDSGDGSNSDDNGNDNESDSDND